MVAWVKFDVIPFRFVVNTRENRFEPPLVHVWVDNQDTCRINLVSGAFIEAPPSGTYGDIMAAYRKNSQIIRESGRLSTGSNK